MKSFELGNMKINLVISLIFIVSIRERKGIKNADDSLFLLCEDFQIFFHYHKQQRRFF